MLVTVRCAVCDASITLPTSKEVYGDGDPFAPEYTQGITSGTGWRTGGPLGVEALYFCSAHVGAPEQHQDRLRAWQKQCDAEAQAAARRWATANPAPRPRWLAWDRPATIRGVFDGPFAALQEDE